MERDFLGLNSKEPWFNEEVNSDWYKQTGFTKSSGIWPFSNKVSPVPVPHLMNFNFAQGDKPKNVGYDPKVSPMFMPTSTMDAIELQKSFNQGRIGGNHFSLTPSYVRHDGKMFLASNHAPFTRNHYATTGQNLPVNSMRPQLLGGIPVTTPHTILPTLGKSVKASGSPSQLTIFYAGEVNVFDDITPEKAQAIMFLAGNRSSLASNSAYQKTQVQTPVLNPVQAESVPANRIINTQLNCGMSSPRAVAAQSGSGSTSTEDQMICRTSGTPTPSTPVSKLEAPKLVNTMASVAATGMIPSVPQARKASLARFLEKRKERVMNAASPYNFSRKSIDYATTLESNA
ncbi:hypothetical protein GQ457_10G027280 [Hibiscus cannabinus]